MTWLTDGTPQLTIEEDVVICNKLSETQCISFHALWDDNKGLNSGAAYWNFQFEQLKESASVGITTKEQFKPGYKIKTLEYNGNLSNGSCLLVSNFGERIKSGDNVGILVSIDGDRIKVYFDLNRTALGLAFDCPRSCLPNAIYPHVSFQSDGRALCRQMNPQMAPRNRALPEFTGFNGTWKLIELRKDGMNQFHLEENYTMEIREDNNKSQLQVYLHIVNNMVTQLTKLNEENYQGHIMISTKMLGPPDAMAVETAMSQLFSEHLIIAFQDSDCQIRNNSIESTWRRYNKVPQPYTGNPFTL